MKRSWIKNLPELTKLVAFMGVLGVILLQPVTKTLLLEDEIAAELTLTDGEESAEEEKIEENSTDEKIEYKDLDNLQVTLTKYPKLIASYRVSAAWVFPPEILIPPPDFT